jgi:regulator of sigma E protease
MEWDDSAKYHREILTTPNSPISISGLGLAYHVQAVVEYVGPDSPAANAEFIGTDNRPDTSGLQKGDLIKEIRSKYLNPKGKEEQTKWIPIKPHQWAYVFAELQSAEPKEIDVKIERSGVNGLIEMRVKTITDETWPMTDRGLYFKPDTRLHKAEDSLDAVRLGMHRTARTVRIIYQNLYGMVFGRVSPWTMSGPLTIADVSYRIAGEDLWQFILFIGMINVNLAVINFLPVPVLDGGHMVFLLYEKIRGKPAPESVLAAAMYIGLACILALMCFVLFLDVKRLFF